MDKVHFGSTVAKRNSEESTLEITKTTKRMEEEQCSIPTKIGKLSSQIDRYDGMWLDDQPHGEGRMIYNNGDVYEGFWYMGQKSGYGVLTKRSGDHFEGHWVNDKREG